MSKKAQESFVALHSLRRAPLDPRDASAQIRRIYFATTKQTIQHDLAHAIELLKGLPTEEDRDRAAVYMDGLAQLRTEWTPRPQRAAAGPKAKKTPSAPARKRSASTSKASPRKPRR